MTKSVAGFLSRLPLSQLLAAGPSWSLRERLVLARRLALTVQALHRQGRIHRSLDAATITVDGQFNPQLPPPPGPRRLGGRAFDPEFCPPELSQGPAVDVPAEIETAAAILRKRTVPIDPRRIDTYQLGVLLCQLLTEEPFLNYLYSPTCKAKVPPLARAVLESCLGENPAGPFVDCDSLIASLDDLTEQLPDDQAASSSETPSAGSVIVSPGDTPPQGRVVVSTNPTQAGENQDMNSNSNQKLPFERLGHFRIIERIGHGGMGDVYRGYDESLERYVAIKVLPAELARDEGFVRRFRAEAAAVAKLPHPNVVPIHFIGEDAGHQFFAMQLVEGESLTERLARQKRLPVEQAVEIIAQCLAGLASAHRQGLVHRDIKPGNVLLETSSGRAMLVDFGLVRRIDGGTQHTATGVVMGTVDYIAPEQVRGQPVDGRTDIYSLGVMFYQLLAGRLPFVADTPTTMIFQHAYEEPFPLRQAAPDVPPSLADIIALMMAKEPAERYPDCAAVLADIVAYRQGKLPSASTNQRSLGRGTEGEDDIANDASFVAALSSLPQDTPWQRARNWAATMFRRYAPEQIQELQSTTQQVDAAVAHYQRRRDRLARLLEEARGLEGEVTTEQVEDLEEQFAQANATLARLRSQGALLKARLKAANARQQWDGDQIRPKPGKRRLITAVTLGLCLFIIGIVFLLSFQSPTQKLSQHVAVPQIETQAPRREKLTEAKPAPPPVVPRPAIQSAITSSPTPDVQIANDVFLDESQRLYRDWTEDTYSGKLTATQRKKISPKEKAAREQRWIGKLSTLDGHDLIQPINQLAVAGAAEAVPALLKIAADPREKDNEARWMAVRALGLIGDSRAVSTLIDLTYHYNQNTRFWAQISLVRLTGQNFGRDATAWKHWWNAQGGKPAASEKIVSWTALSAWADPMQQAEADHRCVQILKGLIPDDGSGAATVIAGSALRGPPRFMEGCYSGITKSRESGFSFRTVPGNDWLPRGLVVPLFHHLGMANDIAEFSIWSDASGEPGRRIATFLVSGITPEPSLCFGKVASGSPPLKGGTTYWLIGSSSTSQINWMCDRDVFNASEAHRKIEGDWATGRHGNSMAFTIYGAAVGPSLSPRSWAGSPVSHQRADIAGSPPYSDVLADLARRNENRVANRFNQHFDQWVPAAKGHMLLVETHDGVPIVPLDVLEKSYPGVSDGLKSPDGIATIRGTTIVFADFSALLKKTAVDAAAAEGKKRKAFIVGDKPYWRALTDMARRHGMSVAGSFDYNYDKFLPAAKGNMLLIETHDGKPLVPFSVLDKVYPGASDGLKASDGIATCKDTIIVFVDFSQLLKIHKHK